MNTFSVTAETERKYIPSLADKAMQGNIIKFSSPEEDRYIKSSDSFLWVLETKKDEIIKQLSKENHSCDYYIKLEALKRITSQLVEAFDDYFS